MYLEHFKLSKPPFSLTPNTDFYCEFPMHKEALNVLLLSLQQGEGFIKIVGEVGTGKTLLCRLLLNGLDESFVTAYIPNPPQTIESLHLSLATELGLPLEQHPHPHQVLNAITMHLLALHQDGKKTILIIDEAQALPDPCLEAVRLLTNIETEEKKLLQVVLFGQPELNQKLKQHALRQLSQRITFSYTLKPLNRNELDIYLCHRLAKAGYTYGSLFSTTAKKHLFHASGGLPRILNILCHKALLAAYGQGAQRVNARAVKRAIFDTERTYPNGHRIIPRGAIVMGISTIIATMAILFYWKYGLIR